LVDHLDADARREAKRILKSLLVKAQVKLRAGQQPAEAFRPAAVPLDLRPYMKRSNVSGVHIYRDGEGWQADILLKATAPGSGTVIGTDVDRPCATREEAVEAAIDMLATVVLIETGEADFEADDTKGDPESGADAAGDRLTFDLEGLQITLEPGFREKVPQSLRDILTSEVKRTLTSYLSRDFPEGMTQEGFDALTPERQGSYAGLAATLLQRGVLEFRREDAPNSH
jgi:hypothetical protein